MGGRGTGKSTLLHFIKACIDQEAEDEKSTYNILKNNLGDGMIVLHVQDEDGKKYKIEKSIEELPQCYSLPNDNFIDINSILSQIDCDIYEAQAIEEIGKNSRDRLDLIDKMIFEKKDEIENDIETLQIELADNCQSIKSENARVNQLRNSLRNYEGADTELKKLLEEKPDDINKKEEKEFENADKNEKIRAAEKRYVKSCQKKLEEIETSITEIKDQSAGLKTYSDNTEAFYNKEILNAVKTEISSLLSQYDSFLKDGIAKLEKVTKKIDFLSSQLFEKHGVQQNEFAKLKQKFEKHKLFYNKWNALTKKIDEQTSIGKDIDTIKQKMIKLRKGRKKLIEQLNDKKKSLFALRKEKVDILNKQFEGSIKITLSYGGITEEYEQSLKNALKGSNMRYNIIIPTIVQNFSPDRFAEIVHTKDYDTLKKIAGIDKERSESIFNALCDTDNIYDIECMYCPDLPEFLLKIDAKTRAGAKGKENYKRSDELSTGQRCTTVLPIVFAVSNNPLIIDQPEDNLDNKYISDTIHEIIRDQKEKRQLIFITHNPNIPVLSDSENNFFLNYAEKKSKVDGMGNIEAVKTNILNLLEGGREAFEKREKLYGLK